LRFFRTIRNPFPAEHGASGFYSIWILLHLEDVKFLTVCDANPDKVLSSERDFIFTNQTEELGLDDWEKLRTRTTGRGAIIPHPQLFGDCNPARRMRWIPDYVHRSLHDHRVTLSQRRYAKQTAKREWTVPTAAGCGVTF